MSSTSHPLTTSRQFEEAVAETLEKHFPFGLLSNVPVFNPNRQEEELLANEVDHLVHYTKDGRDHLLILECKNQLITHSKELGSRAPRSNERWFFHYHRRLPNGHFRHVASDVRVQLRGQMEALTALLDIKPSDNVSIECWVVHTRDPSEILSFNKDQFRAMNLNQLKKELPKLLKNANPVPRNRSPYLAILEKGIPRAGAPHPPLLDALDYISTARRSVDRVIFRRFNKWFQTKANLWALRGTAGSGKSILLAYSLAVLATNHRVSDQKITVSCEGEWPEGVPPIDQRRLIAYGMNQFQATALKKNYHLFLDEIAGYFPHGRPSTCPIDFRVWDGHIPEDCNVLVIDEAHDLDEQAQDVIAAWHKKDPGNRYLIVAVDRQQHIRSHLSVNKPIIRGLDFRHRFNTLVRTYRSPFTVYLTSLALLFRWYSRKGPMIKPGILYPKPNSHIPHSTFKSGIGLFVEQLEKENDYEVWIRNDSHPANYWVRTTDLFSSARDLDNMLTLERIDPEQVLWLRFDQHRSDMEDRELSKYGALAINPATPQNSIDNNIKGMEFPIVVIEGLPQHFDNWSDRKRLWLARRLLYICASRATGFLYFVIPEGGQTTQPRAELKRILDQLQRPARSKEFDTGETWSVRVTFRPGDTQELGDYQDSTQSEEEGHEAGTG